jgi:hypothetical protein
MKIQLYKHQLERVVIKWLNKNFGNLTLKKHGDYPNEIFYINSKYHILIQFSKNYSEILISDNYIWSHLENMFHLKDYYVRSIIKTWAEDTYKLDLNDITIRKFEGDFEYPKEDTPQSPKGTIRF